MSAGVVDEAAAVLRRHARSFAWAAPFLKKQDRNDAALLYAFCRLVDDIADETPDSFDAHVELLRIQEELAGRQPARPFVAAYLDVARRRGIAAHVAEDLLAGAIGDLGESARRPSTFVAPVDDDALELYCYRVAGTVGLMMAAVMGAKPGAEDAAKSLGMAMQLTNICRDVEEDARRGRVYLPVARLRARGTSVEDVLAGRALSSTFAVVEDMLARAETLYTKASAGLPLLPWRARLATLVAGRLYRSIGLEVLRRGRDRLRTRAVVPARKKAFIVVGALASALRAPTITGQA